MAVAPEPLSVDEALRARLAEQSDAMAARWLAEPVAAEGDSLSRLQDGQALLELRQRVRAKPPAALWPGIVIVACSAAVVAFLLFTHVSSTEIEGDMTASELSFVSAAAQPLTAPLKLASLTMAGVGSIDLSSIATSAEVRSGTGARLTASPAPGCAGDITLGPVTVPKATRATLSAQPDGARYRLSLISPALRWSVAVRGCVRLAMPGAGERDLQLTSPKEIVLTLGPGPADLIAEPSAGSPFALAAPLRVQALVLHRIEQREGDGGSFVRQLSTLRSGSIHYEALAGREWKLRVGEGVRFASFDGELSQVESAERALHLRFDAQVAGMSTGSERSRRDVMPTRLEWLKENHGASLFWSSVVYLCGLVVALRNWRKKEQG